MSAMYQDAPAARRGRFIVRDRAVLNGEAIEMSAHAAAGADRLVAVDRATGDRGKGIEQKHAATAIEARAAGTGSISSDLAVVNFDDLTVWSRGDSAAYA